MPAKYNTQRGPDAPIPGQPAAIVVGPRGMHYRARFPYEVAGGRDAAHAAAREWRDRYAPDAKVRGFTGVVRLVWEKEES